MRLSPLASSDAEGSASKPAFKTKQRQLRRYMKPLRSLAFATVALLCCFWYASAQSPWQPLTHQPSFSASTPLLLTDGTVMVHDAGGSNWWKLTPDQNGSYVNGTWSQLASLPDGLSASLLFLRRTARWPSDRRRRRIQHGSQRLDQQGRYLRPEDQCLDSHDATVRVGTDWRCAQRCARQWNLHADRLLRSRLPRRLC